MEGDFWNNEKIMLPLKVLVISYGGKFLKINSKTVKYVTMKWLYL